jgi:hypothetical protein
MTIKIGVQAIFDSQSVTNDINKIGKTIAQANKVKFDPIPAGSIKNMDELEKRFQKLLQLNREMARRVKVSGQSGSSFVDLDWGKLYDNDKTKTAKMAQAFQFVTGTTFSEKKGGGTGVADAAKRAAARAAQAGLGASSGATGGVGGVASNAIGRGMSAGFGAGMMGLLGGIAALGVSKIIGAATEKIGEAESNATANDRLKRVLGDVTVSFGALEASVRDSADQNHVLYSESTKLTEQFSKLGNLNVDDARSAAGEAGTGIGLSRSLGLDSSAGVNALGIMRGLKITNNDQDTKRMALLIGETIGKSDAFAKSAEVMDAISGYATTQTKLSLSAANISAYGGLLSSMIGSGTPGLDPSNSAAILSRIIGTLQQGGGAGEASQFFSSRIAEKNGLNPIAGGVWRESPLSSTSQAFGNDTAIGRYLSKRGIKSPGGTGGSFYGQTLDLLKEQYKDPWMLLEASSKHLGIGKSQAAAMLDMKPNQMGELEGRLGKGFDISKLRGESIATMGKILTGDQGVLNSVAGDLRSRTGSEGLSSEERKQLDASMSSGNTDQMKQTLLSLIATRGQEQTQGKDIHDSKIAIDNMKTLIASQLIPLTQDMRAGILYLAGKDDELSGVDVLNKIAEADSKSRISRISGTAAQEKANAKTEYQKQMDAMALDPNNTKLSGKDWFKSYQEKVSMGTATSKDKADYLSEFEKRRYSGGPQSVYGDNGVAANQLQKDLDERRRKIDIEANRSIQSEKSRLDEEKFRIDKADSIRLQQQDEVSKAQKSGTQIPNAAGNGHGGEQRFVLDATPIEVIHRNERGQQVMPSQSITTTLRPATPFGTVRN